jgi:hypothetical protein
VGGGAVVAGWTDPEAEVLYTVDGQRGEGTVHGWRDGGVVHGRRGGGAVHDRRWLYMLFVEERGRGGRGRPAAPPPARVPSFLLLFAFPPFCSFGGLPFPQADVRNFSIPSNVFLLFSPMSVSLDLFPFVVFSGRFRIPLRTGGLESLH